MRLYSEILDKKRCFSNIVLALIILLFIAILYVVNSCYIKPLVAKSVSCFSYFMINYFNDFWAGVFIAISANLFVLVTRKQYLRNIIFYLGLWLFESLIWEVVRPYILSVFNPFSKNPKFLWGDVLVYGVGTILGYLLFKVFNFKLRKTEETKRFWLMTKSKKRIE